MVDPGADLRLPFEAIVDEARVGVGVATPVVDGAGRTVDFRFVFVNARGAAIIARTAEQIVGRTMGDLRVAQTPGLMERYVVAYEDDAPLCEVLAVRDGPKPTWFDIVVKRFEDFLVVAFDDITEQVLTREREHLAHERMVAAFARVPGAVYSLDRDLRFTYLDADAERLFGAQAADVVGRPMFDLFPDYASEHATLFRHALDFGEPVAFDVHGRVPSDAWYAVRAYPDSEGLTAYVTELGPLLRLEERAAHLERLESVATLTGGIAHDFNNLIMVIGGHASLLASDLGDDHECAEDVVAIADAARRAGELTTQLLSFSRQQVLVPVNLDLNAVVEERVTAWRESAPPGVLVDCIPAEEPVLVRADPSELTRVLDHLARNAFEAMPAGGRLVVETSRFAAGAARTTPIVEGIDEAGFGVVTLTDSGVGMDAETLARASEPFFTTKSRAGSSGLGLSVADGAARQAGGRLAIYSEPGVGTTVRLYLPESLASAPTPGSTGAPASTATLPRGAETILVVDDNASVRALTARILSDLGYEVVSAADGEQALEVVRSGEHEFSLLVLDVVMPGRTGHQLAVEVIALIGPIPVLYVSGYTENSVIARGIAADGVHYLRKPFAPAELAGRVRHIIDVGD